VDFQLGQLEERAGALLAHQSTGRSVVELQALYSNDLIGFIEGVCGARLMDHQKGWARALQDDPRVAIATGHAMGKDFLIAHFALWWAFVKNGLALITSTTQRQVQEQVFGEIARAFYRAHLPGDRWTLAVRSPTGGTILGFTSESESSYAGFHAPLVAVVLSEAQGIAGPAWIGLQSCATGAHDRIIAVGNPLSNVGEFFSCFSDPAWRSFQTSCYEHPNLSGRGDYVFGGPSRAWVERMAAEWGENSPLFESRVLGKFPDQGEHSVYTRSSLDAAVARWHAWRAGTGVLRPDGHRPVFSLDVARTGGDRCALTLRRGPIVQSIVTWSGANLMAAVARVFTEMDRAGAGPQVFAQVSPAKRGGIGRPPQIVVDVIGVGAGVFDRLVEHPWVREFGFEVVAFNASAKATQPAKYFNQRASSYWHLRDQLEENRVALPPDAELLQELLATSWKPGPHGQVQLVAKEEISGMLGRSPDKADSVTMGIGPASVYTAGGFAANI